MQKLKINYGETWGYENYRFNPRDNYFINLLKLRFDVVFDRNPDVVIYSNREASADAFPGAKRLFYCQEVNGPSFLPLEQRRFDVSLSHFEEKGSNIFFPHFMIYVNWFQQDKFRPLPSSPVYLVDLDDVQRGKMQNPKNKFCSLIANNPVKNRDDFYRTLVQYKSVDCYGALNNNTGGPVRFTELEKLVLLGDYKFTMAFENGAVGNYTSEKVLHALACNALPIYFGDGSAKRWFNPEKIIDVADYPSFEAVVDRIRTLDSSAEEYRHITSLPGLNLQELFPLVPDQILNKLCNILNL